MLCYDMSCYVMLCYVMLCYVMLCYVMSHLVLSYSMKRHVFVHPFFLSFPTNLFLISFSFPFNSLVASLAVMKCTVSSKVIVYREVTTILTG